MRAVTIIAVLGFALAASGCGSSPSGSPSAARVLVSVDRCGQGWSHARAGQQRLVLDNVDFRAGEVLLTDARTGAVYADVEPLGPGTEAALEVDLGSGSYAFRCAMEDESTVTGPTVTIPGHARGSAVGVQAVTQADLIAAATSYQNYVRGRLPALSRATATLAGDIAAGDLAAARRDWLPAHLDYERLGAAYGAFGDLDGRINGLASGLPRGVRDPSWAGFHRLEYGLWHGESARALRPVATALREAVDSLSTTFATAQIDPLDIAIRAHEITENALQFELTGQSDYGSHSALATVGANLDGTTAVLRIIRPLLAPRYRGLGAVTAAITHAEHDLAALGNDAGAPPPLDTLSRRAREHIDADISELCELLAPVASILEPRRPS